MNVWGTVLVVMACGGEAGPRKVCDQYLACASALGPELGGQAKGLYGKGGTCWDAEDEATCGDQCAAGLVDLWSATEEEACDPSELGIQAELTEAAFAEQYQELFCAEWDACNTTTECPTGTGTGTTGCAFDPDAARACLDGEWICSDDFPGFEFPVPPPACSDVCGPNGGSYRHSG